MQSVNTFLKFGIAHSIDVQDAEWSKLVLTFNSAVKTRIELIAEDKNGFYRSNILTSMPIELPYLEGAKTLIITPLEQTQKPFQLLTLEYHPKAKKEDYYLGLPDKDYKVFAGQATLFFNSLVKDCTIVPYEGKTKFAMAQVSVFASTSYVTLEGSAELPEFNAIFKGKLTIPVQSRDIIRLNVTPPSGVVIQVFAPVEVPGIGSIKKPKLTVI